MQTAGDEMELFAAVNRKFRHLFNQQEHMKKFRVYDILEVKHKFLIISLNHIFKHIRYILTTIKNRD